MHKCLFPGLQFGTVSLYSHCYCFLRRPSFQNFSCFSLLRIYFMAIYENVAETLRILLLFALNKRDPCLD